LFQQVQGRYLQIRLTLKGDRRTTPAIRALRVHYPRFSYLREYLPDVYQQDPTSMSFLDRFLANPEGILTTLEGLIAQVQTLFDVRTVPPDAVEWLASWLGLALEPIWSDYQRRLLIAQAPYFFQRRGTQLGLLQAILLTLYPNLGPRIFQDDITQLCPTVRIVERFLTRTQPGVAAGDPTETTLTTTNNVKRDAQMRAHRFTVMLPTTIDASTQGLVERIIALEKPAHTAFTVKQYWALFRVGEVRLGFDTVLGQGSQFETFRLGRSALAEAALSDAFPYTLTNRTVISR
jgi:phage tail-like protein